MREQKTPSATRARFWRQGTAAWRVLVMLAGVLAAMQLLPASSVAPEVSARMDVAALYQESAGRVLLMQDEPSLDGATSPPITEGDAAAGTAGTPIPAGTPVPIDPAASTDATLAGTDGADGASGADGAPGESVTGTSGADGQDGQPGEPGQPGRDGKDGADGADGADGQPDQPGQDGQDGQAGADAVVDSNSSGGNEDSGGVDRERRDEGERERARKEKEKEKDKERDGNRGGQDSNGNGGVSEVIANPQYFQQQAELEQQDGTTSTASGAGESGTVNGVPRETPAAAPAVTTGPGAPLAPAEVILPPAVPGLPDAAAIDAGAAVAAPAAAPGIGGTTELVFNAAADTTVFTAAPDSPQSPESAALLALGGPQGAVTLISFDVTGVGAGTVLAARLTFIGGGEAGAPGGSAGVIYDYIVPDGLTANGTPGSANALNVQGVPAWFERVEPGAISAIDVSGSVYGDGAVTFVLPGQPEATALVQAIESGAPPQLILTVALPA